MVLFFWKFWLLSKSIGDFRYFWKCIYIGLDEKYVIIYREYMILVNVFINYLYKILNLSEMLWLIGILFGFVC